MSSERITLTSVPIERPIREGLENEANAPLRIQDYRLEHTSAVRRTNRLRIAVAGCGYWGFKHVRVLSCLPDIAEIAVVDADRRAREKTHAAFPATKVFADLESALPFVDAAIIATPARTHAY